MVLSCSPVVDDGLTEAWYFRISKPLFPYRSLCLSLMFRARADVVSVAPRDMFLFFTCGAYNRYPFVTVIVTGLFGCLACYALLKVFLPRCQGSCICFG